MTSGSVQDRRGVFAAAALEFCSGTAGALNLLGGRSPRGVPATGIAIPHGGDGGENLADVHNALRGVSRSSTG